MGLNEQGAEQEMAMRNREAVIQKPGERAVGR